MKANELRIGNWVYYLGEFRKTSPNIIMTIEYWGVHDKQKANELIKPIPLTEEILLKCGFESRGWTFSFGKISICLSGMNGYLNGRTYFNSWCILESQPKHLHQLQNLYFALTNEELKIQL